jgi:hypothetical protein
LTFGVEPARQPPVGNGIVRALMIEARWAIRIADDLRRAGLRARRRSERKSGWFRADIGSPEDRILYILRMSA